MTLSSREMEVLALAWRCMETEPKIDFEKLAVLANYGSKASANTVFNNIRKKIKSLAPLPSTSASAPSTPRKGKQTGAVKTPRSAKPAAAAGTGSAKKRGAPKTAAANDASPVKKQKQNGKVKVKQQDDDDDNRTEFALSDDDDDAGEGVMGPVKMEVVDLGDEGMSGLEDGPIHDNINVNVHQGDYHHGAAFEDFIQGAEEFSHH